MANTRLSLAERLDFCRVLCTETSKIAGIAKGLKELSEIHTDPEARYYFKNLLEVSFKQLMINLNVLTLDKYSDVRIADLIKLFQETHRDRLVELGQKTNMENEEKYRVELAPSIRSWNSIRRSYAAHRSINSNHDWEVNIDDISIFLSSVRNIVNTMNQIIATPLDYPSRTNSTLYSITAAIDLEDESYLAIKNKLIWKIADD